MNPCISIDFVLNSLFWPHSPLVGRLPKTRTSDGSYCHPHRSVRLHCMSSIDPEEFEDEDVGDSIIDFLGDFGDSDEDEGAQKPLVEWTTTMAHWIRLINS